MNDALATLSLEHLRHEEAMLRTALAIVGAIQNAFSQGGLDAFAAVLGRHRDFAGIIADIQRRRRAFADAAASQMGVPSKDLTMSVLLDRVHDSSLEEAVARIRKLAHELAAANFVVSVHVRVHLDAYRRILRDLTQTKDGSGRYGRGGQAETLDYRPLLQING